MGIYYVDISTYIHVHSNLHDIVAGGVYVPPFKLARLQQKTDDTKSAAYQRQMWEALRKSINGLVNKVNVSNITQLVQVITTNVVCVFYRIQT